MTVLSALISNINMNEEESCQNMHKDCSSTESTDTRQRTRNTSVGWQAVSRLTLLLCGVVFRMFVISEFISCLLPSSKLSLCICVPTLYKEGCLSFFTVVQILVFVFCFVFFSQVFVVNIRC